MDEESRPTPKERGDTGQANFLGFLIIYDSRRQSNKIGQNETVNIGSKDIFMVWV
ncbi:MAG: hypothetical protein QG657_2824 [Acidobacteriota bacterium]|nr:hypothetical protein [Acidobacteriota bacterium]